MMDKQKRKELRDKAMQIKTMMGVYKIENTQSGKLYISSSSNLKNQWMRQQMQLDDGKHMNLALQKDYTDLGEAAFAFSILEEHEVEPDMDVTWELSQMEKTWLAKLEPYDEKGYNHRKQQ